MARHILMRKLSIFPICKPMRPPRCQQRDHYPSDADVYTERFVVYMGAD